MHVSSDQASAQRRAHSELNQSESKSRRRYVQQGLVRCICAKCRIVNKELKVNGYVGYI
jgi:hypothetical protein